MRKQRSNQAPGCVALLGLKELVVKVLLVLRREGAGRRVQDLDDLQEGWTTKGTTGQRSVLALSDSPDGGSSADLDDLDDVVL